MARPFTYVSSQMYYDFEIYFFKLAMYTDSEEYFKLPTKSRIKIDEEITRIANLLGVMDMFRQVDSAERAIVGRKTGNEENRMFVFTSATVAAKVLGINKSKISAVCRGERHTAGGYVFEYYEEYEPVIRERPKWYNR